jgi:hypothetical protein
MNIDKAYSRTSFISIFLVIVILLALVDFAFYYGMDMIFSKITISMKAGSAGPELPGLMEKISRLDVVLRTYFVPVSAGVFLLFGLMLWLYLKSAVRKLANQAATPLVKESKSDSVAQKAAEKQKKELRDQRHFIHLLSVLQREGRLVDFFSENLDEYEDSQIGAAVRSIHENCQKTINKYMTLKAIIDQNEGDNVIIEYGFDPNTIKLVGNVAGEPPFKGILRHRGWQVTKLDLPKLSDTGKLQAISPAEVEIQ